MSVQWKSLAQAAGCAAAAAIMAVSPIGIKAQAPAGAQAGAGGRGGAAASPLAPSLSTAFDADKDGNVPAAEVKTAFDTWYDAADTQKSGSITQEQLTTALTPVFGAPAAAPAGAAPAGRAGGGFGGGAAAPFVA